MFEGRQRRARNAISRDAEISVRAAELLDDGEMTDEAIARRLAEEFPGRTISRKTVASFRTTDYEVIRAERAERQEAAEAIRLIVEAGKGSGADFTEAAQDILARTLYEALKHGRHEMSVETAERIGRGLAKIGELQLAKAKLEMQREKLEAGQQAAAVAGDTKLTAEERQAKIREVFGL